MKLSQYYLPTLDVLSSDIVAKSHKLMLRAGIIKQHVAGIYTILPFGFKVLQKIEKIIQEELDKIGCQRLNIPILQPRNLWDETGRSEAYGPELLRMKDRHNNELFYSPTAEEMIVDIFRSHVFSYKQLPVNLYQINWKFRDEMRPRFGLLRAREFYMMDSYSFHGTQEDAEKEYYKMYECYLKIFARCGVIAIPMSGDTGQIGGSLSHEFQVLAESGESTVYYEKKIHNILNNSIINDKTCQEILKCYAATEEMHKPDECNIKPEELIVKKGIEVGQIFYLGDKYTKSMNVNINDNNGTRLNPVMGCYGIGLTRLMSAIIEASSDENGIIWPISVSPFSVIIINLDSKNEIASNICNNWYQDLISQNVDVLYDDTNGSVGEKLNKADLIGIPIQIIIGKKSISDESFEIKRRVDNIKHKYKISQFKEVIKQCLNS